MTFLNPLALIGLAAAGIPVLIHLLNLRKLKTIDFSSLRFLRELQRTSIRRVRIRQILLLILRTLLIIFLVLAFARPALRESWAGLPTGSAPATTVIMLDDSPSMSVRNERGILFDQARTAAGDIVRLSKPGDRLFILRLSDIARGTRPAPVPSMEAGLEFLRSSSPTLMTRSYAAAVAWASEILRSSRNANRELYLLTDGQATQFTGAEPGTDTAATLDAGTRVFAMTFPAAAETNLGIVSVQAVSQILAPHRPLTMRAVLRNSGGQTVTGSVASMYLNGARVGQQTIDLNPGSTTTVTFTAIPTRTGLIAGSVRLEDDALAADNIRHFLLRVPGNIRVLCIGASEDDTRFVRLALASGGDSTGVYAIRSIAEDQLRSTDIRAFDVLVLCGITQLSADEAARIARFVADGRGVILFPGPATNLAQLSTLLLTPLGIPPMALETSSTTGRTDSASSFLSFGRFDESHPVFAGIFAERSPGNRGRSLESPRVRHAVTLRTTGRQRVVLALSDGRPFLAEYPAGGGRAWVFAVDPGMAWSDFPLKGIFVPLMHRSVLWLASPTGDDAGVTAGDPLTAQVRLHPGVQAEQLIVRAPSGLDVKVRPVMQPVSGSAVAGIPLAEETGIYTVRATGADSSEPLQAVAVNIKPAESDLQAAPAALQSGFWKAHGIAEVLPIRTSIAATMEETRYGAELWKPLLMLALLCALAEMIIGRTAPVSAPGEEHTHR